MIMSLSLQTGVQHYGPISTTLQLHSVLLCGYVIVLVWFSVDPVGAPRILFS